MFWIDLTGHFDLPLTCEFDRVSKQILNNLLETSLVEREARIFWLDLLDVTSHFQVSIRESQDVDVDDLENGIPERTLRICWEEATILQKLLVEYVIGI